MKTRLLILLVISFLPGTVFSQDTALAPTTEVEILAPVELIKPLQIQVRESGRNWTEAELTQENISQSFEVWLECKRNPSAPGCCESPVPSDANVILMNDIAEPRCLPNERDSKVVFSRHLSETQKRTRNRRICSCLRSDEAGLLEKVSYDLAQNSPEKEATVDFQNLKEKILNERYMTAYQLASFANSPSEFRELGVYGTAVSFQPIDSVQRKSLQTAEAIYDEHELAHSNDLRTLDSRTRREIERIEKEADGNLDEEVFNNRDLPPNYCLPYRSFVAKKQFPEEKEFYDMLDGMKEYKNEEWNYLSLVGKLTNRLGDIGLEEIMGKLTSEPNDPTVKEVLPIILRLRFLEHNPVIKNVFMSGNAEAGAKMFDVIRTLPRPKFRNGEIFRYDKNWENELKEYRQRFMGLLGGENREKILRASDTGARAFRSHTLKLGVAQKYLDENKVAPPEVDVTPTNASVWKPFCEDFERYQSVHLFNQISQTLNPRKPLNPLEDKEYEKDNNRACNTKRRSKGNVRPPGDLTFFEYHALVCQGKTTDDCSRENMGAMLETYTANYDWIRRTGEEVDIAHSYSTFASTFKPVEVTREDLKGFSRVTSSSDRFRRPIRFTSSEYQSLNSGSSAVSSSSLNVPSSESSTSTQTSLAPQTAQNQALGGMPIITPDEQAASRQAATDAEVVNPQRAQEQLRQSDQEIQGIREDLANLNRDLSKENSKAPAERNEQVIADLNSKLDQMNRRLDEATRNNRSLREQITELEEANRNPRPQRVANEVKRSPASQAQSSAPAAAVQRGAETSGSNGSMNASMNNSAASGVGGGASSSLSRAPARLSSGNAALLSKYGIQNGTVQGGLVVANATSSIDYQSLRSQSANNVIPLALSPEDFNLIARNDQSVLNRYLDRVKAMPGNVVRLDISAEGIDGRPLEFFVLKSGNDLSIVPGISSTPSRSPASLPPAAREFTLESLRQELGN